jgi:hypothetical protein
LLSSQVTISMQFLTPPNSGTTLKYPLPPQKDWGLSMSKPARSRRKIERLKCSILAMKDLQAFDPRPCLVLNLSFKGAGVLAWRRIEPRTTVALSFKTKGGEFLLKAQEIWSKKQGSVWHTGFVFIRPLTEDTLEKLLAMG